MLFKDCWTFRRKPGQETGAHGKTHLHNNAHHRPEIVRILLGPKLVQQHRHLVTDSEHRQKNTINNINIKCEMLNHSQMKTASVSQANLVLLIHIFKKFLPRKSMVDKL